LLLLLLRLKVGLQLCPTLWVLIAWQLLPVVALGHHGWWRSLLHGRLPERRVDHAFAWAQQAHAHTVRFRREQLAGVVVLPQVFGDLGAAARV